MVPLENIRQLNPNKNVNLYLELADLMKKVKGIHPEAAKILDHLQEGEIIIPYAEIICNKDSAGNEWTFQTLVETLAESTLEGDFLMSYELDIAERKDPQNKRTFEEDDLTFDGMTFTTYQERYFAEFQNCGGDCRIQVCQTIAYSTNHTT